MTERNPATDPCIGDAWRTGSGLLRTVISVGTDGVRLRKGHGGPAGRHHSTLLSLARFADQVTYWTLVPR